jgi:hypothetical protein
VDEADEAVLKCRPVSEGLSHALALPNTEAALRIAIEFWADGSTRAETFERASKLRDKTQAVKGFFAS